MKFVSEKLLTVVRGLVLWLSKAGKIPITWKTFLLATFASSVGAGLYITGSAVYFVRNVGLTAPEVGAGLSAAGLVGLGGGILAGRLADRFGARNVAIAAALFSVPILVAITQVRTFGEFFVCSAIFGLAISSQGVAEGAIVATVAAGQESQLASYSRSVINAGFSIGLLCAGIAISVGTRSAFVALFLGNAAALALAAIVMMWLPHTRLKSENSTQERTAIRDLPYLLVGQISTMINFTDVILTTGLPLWIVLRTHAPRGLAAWLLTVNTILVITMQARATRQAGTVDGASKLQRRAFIVLAVSCIIAIPTRFMSAWPAAIVLIVVVVLLTGSELWGQGAWFKLRYALAPADAQGEYGGVFALGQAIPGAAGPVLVTTLTVTVGAIGWLALACMFIVCAVLQRYPVEWAQRTRTAEPASNSATVSANTL